MRRSGFTLIELLVVVAIIAILALIALPNMMAARTRAKVSRAKSDLRTVVTGIEAYHVDHNGYPTYHYSNVPSAALNFHMGGKVPAFGVPDPDWNGAIPITTPVAYLSVMPEDTFADHRRGEPDEVRQLLYVNWPYAIQQVPSNPVFPMAYKAYGAYRLHSRGPDLVGPNTGTPYDPTNGTVSDGDITYGPNTGLDRYVPLVP
ncbi:MAG: prepilin-type N-terminal cleavage/methylation domain-containing protein [Candidatus Sumerlaeaceae bacterium]|nr:prepilin-type N-terminal cleavage/methylation domain-containing protein [Candidatus Sumerlaeaceae bacterium]